MMKKGRLEKNVRSSELDEGSNVNPMDGLGNLADVMLVLAVGIMLALVTAWNIDIALTTPGATDSGPEDAQQIEEAQQIDNVEVSPDSEEISEDGLTEYGRVYVDADGNFYVEPFK